MEKFYKRNGENRLDQRRGCIGTSCEGDEFMAQCILQIPSEKPEGMEGAGGFRKEKCKAGRSD